tara:strand:- start:66 stop:281 length:216 start_codon:yes stop_codon:yes gene_type:complete
MSEEKKKRKTDWVSFNDLTPEEKQSLHKELENALTAPLPQHIKKVVEALSEWETSEEFLRQFQEVIISNDG